MALTFEDQVHDAHDAKFDDALILCMDAARQAFESGEMRGMPERTHVRFALHQRLNAGEKIVLKSNGLGTSQEVVINDKSAKAFVAKVLSDLGSDTPVLESAGC